MRVPYFRMRSDETPRPDERCTPLARPWRCFLSLVVCAVVVASGGCRREPELPEVGVDNLVPAQAELIRNAREAVRKAPRDGWAWGRYGQTLEATEFLEQAEFCYGHAQRLAPEEPRWPYLLGLLQLRDAPAAALANLTVAIQVSGSSNEIPRLKLAQVLVELGRHEEAIPHLTVVAGSVRVAPAANLEWARVLLHQRRYPDAISRLSGCLSNPYTARPAMILLSQIHAREGRHDLATQVAGKSAAMPRPFDWPDPFVREVQDLRQTPEKRAEQVQGLLARGRLEDAERELSALMSLFPDHVEGKLLVGRLHLQKRACPEAETQFREHLESAGETVNGMTQLSLALLCQQKWAEAERTLGRLLELKPDFAQAHANRGLARSRLGDSTGAIASYRDALRTGPGTAGFHVGLAEELARTGARDEAKVHVRRALSVDPKHPGALSLQERLRPEQ